jgi:hypothetical protein
MTTSIPLAEQTLMLDGGGAERLLVRVAALCRRWRNYRGSTFA